MQLNIKQYRDIVVVSALLIVPFFFLKASMRAYRAEGRDAKDRPENLSATDRTFLRVSAPVEYAVARLARGISQTWQSYVYLVDVKADHEKLTYENARLREALRAAEDFQRDNQELRRLLELRKSTPGELVSGMIVQKDFNDFFRVTRVVVDRGSRDIRDNMPVLAPDGVVGKVLGVSGDSVNIRLAVDTEFGVDVEDVRTKARGYVRGTGDPSRYLCKVEMLEAGDEVEEGDLLATSGRGKWFPQGIPVAKITKIKQRERGREQEVEATPSVNFSKLDTVLILINPAAEQKDQKPTKEK